MTRITDTVVRIAPGAGLIARRDTALLFVPAPSSDTGALHEAFDRAASDEVLDAVTRFADAAAAAGGPTAGAAFALVDWSSEMRVVANGDVEITSDVASLPRLSAAGAGTWIERAIRAADGAVTVGVNAADVDAATDLRHGTVHAGGFALSRAPAVVPDPESALTADELAPPPDQTAEPATEPAPTIEPAATTAGAIADQVLGGALDPRYAAAPDDITIVPDDELRDEIAGLVDSIADGDQDDDLPLPPTADFPLPPSADSPLPPSPEAAPNWGLVFTDGTVLEVDRTLVLGRKPVLRDGEDERTTRLVTLDCAQVSSRHLAVRPEGPAISIVDLGSSNGSFVLTTGDGQLIQLEPGVPHQIGDGTIVQIGTKRFHPERR